MNNRGQFSIIAAMFIAVILISSVMITYATIRFGSNQEQPQVLSAIDETNLALKKVLGFTVGYYGSILQITGNSSYAYEQSANYLNSGLANIAEISPEWSFSYTVTDLQLKTNWFMNQSYSKGILNVTYSLTGLGISGVAYSASLGLSVNIFPSDLTQKVLLNVTRDDGEPVNDLSRQNFEFYRYRYGNLTWQMASPTSEPIAYSNGTYLIDIPTDMPEINPYAYLIQVKDTRGLAVSASSYSRYTGTLIFNSTFEQDNKYVEFDNSNVDGVNGKGTHSDFAAQQAAPDSNYDTLTEGNAGTQTHDFFPESYTPIGGTTWTSGPLSSLQANDGSYMTFQAYPTAFSGTTTFGYSTKGSSMNDFSSVRGSLFTTSSFGFATSMSANLKFTSTNGNFGNINTGSSGDSIENVIRGGRFTSPSSMTIAQDIRAYIYCSTNAKNMKAAIYTSGGNLVAETEEKSIPASGSANWQTFNFPDPKPALSAATNYILVVWSQSGGGSANLRYSSTFGGNGRYDSSQYGTWPLSMSFSSNSYQYSIRCDYVTAFEAKAAIYSASGNSLIATTEEKTIASTIDGWVSFDFLSPPSLSASTQYVLVAWASDSSNVNIYYNTGTAHYFRGSGTYPNWPSSMFDQGSSRTYSINCTYSLPSEYKCEVEFGGEPSNLDAWNSLMWTIESSSTTPVNITYQLFNYTSGDYSQNGFGYMTDSTDSAGKTSEQTINANASITVNPTDFRDDNGRWKLRFTVVKSTSSPFSVSLDLTRYRPGSTVYALDLEEQWTNLDITHQPELCIKTGTLALGDNLAVDVWRSQPTGHWDNVGTLINENGWTNISISSYVSGSTFTIRYSSGEDLLSNSWQIDSLLIRSKSDQSLFTSLGNTATEVEVLQNGTMRWLGQNLRQIQPNGQEQTQGIPIPPVPVKAIHINQTTIGGAETSVHFQIEDWSSGYTVPLGLTSNATVFGNRQMIVFLVNPQVAEFSIWWNGSDEAVQTPLAYSSSDFSADNPDGHVLNNGRLSLSFHDGFTVTSTAAGTSSSATFMRINNETSVYGSSESYVIVHGVVRDVVQQEAEWGTAGSAGGADGSPNLYANMVLTLPAQASYYTYQLRLMFINSAQTRTIADLCPIKLSSSIGGQMQTENGTILSDPIVAVGTQTFSSSPTWGHHWSQFISGSRGAGIMFTDSANQMLYIFDSYAPATVRGALSADSSLHTIEMLPVKFNSVAFQTPLDVTWNGAVATFDGTPPIYGGQGQPGLWILAEIPPIISVSTDS